MEHVYAFSCKTHLLVVRPSHGDGLKRNTAAISALRGWSEGRAEGYSLIFTVLSYFAPTVARLLQKSPAANKIHSLYVRGVLLKK